MSKESRVKAEYDRLKAFFKDVPEDKAEIVEHLIQNSAFMMETLQELQEKINEKGVVSVYKNGANQYGTKASAELQSYNQLIKNYTTVQEKLLRLLPNKKSGQEPDLLEQMLEELGI